MCDSSQTVFSEIILVAWEMDSVGYFPQEKSGKISVRSFLPWRANLPWDNTEEEKIIKGHIRVLWGKG